MISALLATACIWAARRMWAEEPRRLRIAALALVGAWFGFWALLEISAYLGVPAALVLPLGALLLPFSVVALAVILIRNGMHMLTREGRSLGNSLSLLAGLALFASGERHSGLAAVMAPFAQALSPQDMRDVGAFFAQQKAGAGVADDTEVADGPYAGLKYYEIGQQL